jgi:hypothetical protein
MIKDVDEYFLDKAAIFYTKSILTWIFIEVKHVKFLKELFWLLAISPK